MSQVQSHRPVSMKLYGLQTGRSSIYQSWTSKSKVDGRFGSVIYLVQTVRWSILFDLDLSTFGSDGMEDALFYDDVDEPNVDWNQRNEQDVLDLDFQESNIVNIARRQLIPGKEQHCGKSHIHRVLHCTLMVRSTSIAQQCIGKQSHFYSLKIGGFFQMPILNRLLHGCNLILARKESKNVWLPKYRVTKCYECVNLCRWPKMTQR